MNIFIRIYWSIYLINKISQSIANISKFIFPSMLSIEKSFFFYSETILKGRDIFPEKLSLHLHRLIHECLPNEQINFFFFLAAPTWRILSAESMETVFLFALIGQSFSANWSLSGGRCSPRIRRKVHWDLRGSDKKQKTMKSPKATKKTMKSERNKEEDGKFVDNWKLWRS